MEPQNLQALVLSSTNALSDVKKKNILSMIERMSKSKDGPFVRFLAAYIQQGEADEYSGFKEFDNEKFLNAVLYFCREGVFKTKLNKLLFYADFKHFKEYHVSITGARYARMPFGPAPDGYDLYYSMLARQGAIEVEEVFYPEYTGEEYRTKQDPNLNIFSGSELRILVLVKERFEHWNAKTMSDFSHEEKGYKNTDTGRPIAYKYAEELRI